MNKTVTKIISTLMVVALLLCCTVTSPNIRVSAAANGTCGENLTWVLDDEGTLTISGTGKMDDFNWNDTPWHRAGDKNDIKEVVIGDDVTSIGDDAFADLGALSKVTIGNSVTEIGYDAFYNCTELTYVRIPDSVTSIGKNAFYSCCSLTGIYIADNVTTIGKDAFSYCPALAEFEVSEQNENYCDIDGVLFTKDKKRFFFIRIQKVPSIQCRMALSESAIMRFLPAQD